MKIFRPLLLIFLTTVASADDLKPVVDQLSPTEVKATWEKLNNLITKSGGIDPVELDRARLQGVLQKLGKNTRLSSRPNANSITVGVDFKEEMLPRSVYYVRLGDLSADNISQFSQALKRQTKVAAVILDLRATQSIGGYDLAANLTGFFTGSGKTLFTLANNENGASRSFTGQNDVLFKGILLVLVNEDTDGPAEVVAAALRQQVHALVVGRKTKGEALEYSPLFVKDGVNLEIAIGRIVLPGLAADFLQDGVKPDLTVTAQLEDEREILRRSDKEGMGAYIFEVERPHMNEASLVAGRNPELDNYQERKLKKQASEPTSLLDRSLQRALDTATTLLVLQESGKTGN